MTEPRLDLDGPAAPPRRNGELVFAAPWQSRVFGLTAALVEAGRIDWTTFQNALIARIAAADDEYWDSWTDALGDLCAEQGIVTEARWKERSIELASRPAGHDHGDEPPRPERPGSHHAPLVR